MPPGPFLTTAGWTLNGLIMQGPRFRKIPRVSVSDKNLEATIRKHESSGAPLIIEGVNGHQAWPTAMFNVQWLCDNLKQQIQVRNVHNRRDLNVSFAEFLEHVKSIHRYASADETTRWYAKDIECPREWKEWLDTTPLVPRSLCPHGSADIMQNLPEQARVETLMCYLGIGDTFTPCHKDLCASFGHNLMCHAEDGASAFWFMTESSAAPLMAKYFQSLGQELDLESHTMSIEEFAAAPCDIYITEQKAGDLVLVPQRSCHQVVNHGGLTAKMSWSRMTIRSTQIALRHELPIYRRVCRVETYRIKSTIHHTLRRNTGLLEDLRKRKDTGSFHDIFREQLAKDVQKLLELFRVVILEECYPDAEILDHVIQDFNHNVYDTEGYPAFTCDFCGSDIFVSFFCCKDCSPSAQSPESLSDGLHICPGCYAEGRSCGCGELMEPVQCWPLQILYGDYNRAVRALKGVGVDIFDEVDERGILDNCVTRVFEAGIAIQKWRTEISKGGSQCYARAQPHAVHNAAILHCKKCRKGHCFVHLAEAGIHSSEAITLYKNSQEQSTWHEFHLKKRTFASETILAAEASGDDVSSLIGQKLAMVALSYAHCQPVNNISHIRFGWYDRLKSTGVATFGSSSAMDMSFPREGSDWGSSLTDICPEDSASNKSEPEPAKLRTSRPATARSSTVMKRKRTFNVFDGVAPPERKRKMNARHSESPPGAALPRSATYVKSEEKSQGPPSTQPSTVVLSNEAIKEICTHIVAAQDRKFDALIQGNADLRDGLQNLSQIVLSNKRDIQRLENIITKMANDMKDESEMRREKIENRDLRWREEFSSKRANPPAPAHVPVTFPSTASYPPEPSAGNSEWATRNDHASAEPNKLHYQENYERNRQPNNKSNRGGFRPYRGRGRGPRGHSGNHSSNQRHHCPPPTEGWGNGWPPSTPVVAPASTQVLAPHSISVPNSYHSQGYAPPPQSPHTSHSHLHPIASSPTHSRPHPHAHLHTAQPTSPELATAQQTRRRQGAHPQVYEHEHAGPRDHPQPPPRLHERRPALSPAPAPQAADDGYRPGDRPRAYEHGHARPRDSQPPPPPRSHEQRSAPASTSQAADDGYRHPQDYDHKHARPRDYPQPSTPPPPRSREWRPAPTPAPAPAPDPTPAPQTQTADDGYREAHYADSYPLYSPVLSDEQVRWTSTPTPSESLGGQQRRQSPSQSRGSSPSRSYVGHSRHADEVRGGRRAAVR